MLDNAADRKSIRRREKAVKFAERQRAEILTQLMSTISGRRWIWDILASCHCWVTTFNGDALQSAYQEGQRSIGLALLADILLHCPDAYITAMRESAERARTEEARDESEDGDPDLIDDDEAA